MRGTVFSFLFTRAGVACKLAIPTMKEKSGGNALPIIFTLEE
jgi:hypothetical protein